MRALLEECVRLLTEIGAESELSGAMKNLAIVHLKQGNYAEAIDLAERSLRLGYRDTIDPTMRLDTLSGALSECGRHAEAIHIQRRRLLLALERREQFAVGHSLLHLTKMRIRGGDIAPAVAERRLRVVRRELIRCATNGHVADAQIHIGDQLRAQGRYTEAIAEITADLTVMRELDIWIQAQACNYLGRARLGAGDPAGAIVEHQQALKIAGSAGYRIEQARAHLGLGDCLAGTDPAAADQRWREAARIFTELGVPEQADAERRLRGTD